jgi:hypothetical protein
MPDQPKLFDVVRSDMGEKYIAHTPQAGSFAQKSVSFERTGTKPPVHRPEDPEADSDNILDVSTINIPYRPNCPTQQAGARAVKGVAGEQCRRILHVLAEAGEPLTREEICELAGIKNQAACGRLNELERMGLVRQSGLKRASSGVMVKAYAARENSKGAR